MRENLAAYVVGQRIAIATASSSLATKLTQILQLALSTDNAAEAFAALGRILAKLNASGRDQHDIVVAIASKRAAARKRAAQFRASRPEPAATATDKARRWNPSSTSKS